MTPCSKCGCSDIPKYQRIKLRENGDRTLSIYSHCILCEKEDKKIIEAKRYNKKLAYNRKWCKKNRKLVNKYKREDYWKNKMKDYNPLMPDAVEWHGHVNRDGFSQMTYTPLYVGGKR